MRPTPFLGITGISYFQAILAEVVGTFLFMLSIMGTAVNKKATPGFAGGPGHRAHHGMSNHNHRQHSRLLHQSRQDLWPLPCGLHTGRIKSMD